MFDKLLHIILEQLFFPFYITEIKSNCESAEKDTKKISIR